MEKMFSSISHYLAFGDVTGNQWKLVRLMSQPWQSVRKREGVGKRLTEIKIEKGSKQNKM